MRGNDAKSRSPGCKSSIGCRICDILCCEFVRCSTKIVKQSSHCWQPKSKAKESGALSTGNISFGSLPGQTGQREFSAWRIPSLDKNLFILPATDFYESKKEFNNSHQQPNYLLDIHGI
ncbi:hypothetical protein AVDCRST_MAG84-4197 [uncultured Microcoleus sp.]|uniref:Uncharacterized protein n=1 Tax=uncultured Microcoleus sp. TaxID=259945 RepID=A0A6J4MXY0_9CYAN|nr:hypothetical protein AVDCRST_MAG84-4197 [uncultured Microcoleus sp.]